MFTPGLLNSGVRSYITDYGIDMTGTAKWTKAVAVDDIIYIAPRNATGFLVINTTSNTAVSENFGIALGTSSKHFGMARADDGRLFCPPYDAGTCTIIDPSAYTATQSKLGATLSGSNLYTGAVKSSVNGKIYCAPYASNYILVIDPETNSAVETDFGINLSLLGGAKFIDAVETSTGKIYLVPTGSKTLVIIDPATDTASTVSLDTVLSTSLPATIKWDGGGITSDDIIICAPSNFNKFLIIDTTTPSYALTDYSFDMSGNSKWNSGINISDDRLFFSPGRKDDAAVIASLSLGETSDMGLSIASSSMLKWWGGALVGNNLYLSPFDHNGVAVVPLSAL